MRACSPTMQVWVKHIKAALAENRFRLVQQPIASLAGGTEPMFDMLVRMLDRQGKEVLPSEFMPAAERNDLVAHIDRWVIWLRRAFARAPSPAACSCACRAHSALDARCRTGCDAAAKPCRLEPGALCIQITEDVATRHPGADRRSWRAA